MSDPFPNNPPNWVIGLGCAALFVVGGIGLYRADHSSNTLNSWLGPALEEDIPENDAPEPVRNMPTQRELRESPAGEYVMSIHGGAFHFELNPEWSTLAYERPNGKGSCVLQLAPGVLAGADETDLLVPAETGIALECRATASQPVSR